MKEQKTFGRKGRIEDAPKAAKPPRKRRKRNGVAAGGKRSDILRKDIGPSGVLATIRRMFRFD